MNRRNVYVSSSSSSGIGFFGLLQIVFIVLKVLEIINWNWWLVLMPTWIGLGIVIITLIICIVAYLIEERF